MRQFIYILIFFIYDIFSPDGDICVECCGDRPNHRDIQTWQKRKRRAIHEEGDMGGEEGGGGWWRGNLSLRLNFTADGGLELNQ